MYFSKFDFKMFEMAYRVAEQSDFHPFHLGCVITYKGKVISTGYNQNKSHPTQKKYNKRYRHFKKGKRDATHSLHAELAALVNIPKCVQNNIDMSKCHVYIYRICSGKPLGFGNAFCCNACRHALIDAGVRHIYYTTDYGFSYTELEEE